MKRLRDTGLLLAVLSVWTVPAGAQALFGNTYGDTATTQQEVESPLLQIQPWPGEAEQGGPTGQSAEETVSSYRVLGGDSLSRIAGEVYGDSGLWPAIFNANYDLLRGDPGLIVPGMRLEIPGFEDALADAVPRNIVARAATENTGRSGRANAGGSWIYSEGIARAIRREFMTFESAGRIAYLDPDLKEGDQVSKGQVIAYQDQRRPLAEIENAESSIVAAQTQLAVAEATQMEVAADLRLAERTFERFSVLLQQNSASQQEYDEAQAQLESARAAAVRASRQIETAQAQIRVAEATRSTASVVRDESYLIAPIDGVVARINYDQGDYYSPQLINTATEQQVFDTVPVILIDPSRFEISLNVPSNLLDTLEVGADVLIGVIEPDATLADRLPDVSAGPPKPASDYSIAGQVYAISPVFDTDLRNFLVKVRTSRGNEYLRDGATVSMWIRKRG